MAWFRRLTKEQDGRIVAVLRTIPQSLCKHLQWWARESVKTSEVMQHLPWLLFPQPSWEVGEESARTCELCQLIASSTDTWLGGCGYHIGMRQDFALIKKDLPESLCNRDRQN